MGQPVATAPSESPARAGRTTPELFLILLFVLLTRLSLGEEARYGIWIGSVPIFPTDVTLILLIAFTAWRGHVWFKRWLLSGKGADSIGRAVWWICLLATVYFIVALPTFRILAFRDLAMFGYSLFFPLSYMAIHDRRAALKVTRYLVYGSLILGVPLAIWVVTGWNLGFQIEAQPFMTPFGALQRVPVGDLGPNLGYTFSAVLSYLLLKGSNRWVNIAVAAVSVVVIAAQLTRSAVLCVATAAFLTLLVIGKRQRIALLLFGGLAVVLLVSHSFLFQDLSVAVKSATTILDDADVEFRLLRWAEALALWLAHPVLGAGFGVEICSPDPTETGVFNVGMPHNSYLTVLARMGVVGLGLFLFCYGRALYLLVRSLRNRGLDADSLAVANILIAMGVYAGFNLFLEEPLLIAPFWIMLAVACRLAETSPLRLAVARRRSPVPISSGGHIHAAV